MTTIIDKDLTYCQVPEGASNARVITLRGIDNTLIYTKRNGFAETLILPEGYQYEVIGLVPGLSEEQCRGLVEEIKRSNDHDHRKIYDCFKDYEIEEGYFNTALESFASRMEAAGAYLVNPYGEREPDRSIHEPCFRVVPECCGMTDKYGGCCNNPNPRQVEDYTEAENPEWRQWTEAQSCTSKSWVVMRVKGI